MPSVTSLFVPTNDFRKVSMDSERDMKACRDKYHQLVTFLLLIVHWDGDYREGHGWKDAVCSLRPTAATEERRVQPV